MQIALIAGLVQILLVLFLNNNIAALGTVDFILTMVSFAFVIGAVAHWMGKEKLTMFTLFLTGFLGIIIYNQGIVLLNLINNIPFSRDFLVGLEMGVLMVIVGRIRGIK